MNLTASDLAARTLWAVALGTACGGALVACGSSDSDPSSTGGSAGAGGASGASGAGAQAGNAGAVTGGTAGSGGAAGTGGVAGGDASAGGSDASGDGASGAPGDAGVDAATDGSSTDGAGGADGASDAGTDAPVSTFCGDGIRDPVTEECDDGSAAGVADSCSVDCRVQDLLFAAGPGSSQADKRTPGEGGHTVAAGGSGFAMVFVEESVSPMALRLRAFDSKGTPGNLVTVAQDATITSSADPVIAALPDGKYAVAYTDLHADGYARGVALRIVDATTKSIGPVVRVNAVTHLNQEAPDMIWTGSELVVAYVDQSNIFNKGDVRVRTFDAKGNATSSDGAVAATKNGEGLVALTPFAGGYAATWWELGSPTQDLVVQVGTNQWTLSLPKAGVGQSAPSLVELDGTHLLVVYALGGSGGIVPRLQGAVVDTAQSNSPTPFDIAPLIEPYASDSSLGQEQPATARVGNSVFVAWKADSIPASTIGRELWLKEVPLSGGPGTLSLNLSSPEMALPRSSAHTAGHQALPALASTPLGPGGAVVAGWEDRGHGFGSAQGTPDVVAELMPVPIVRLPFEGGLQ